MVERMANDAHSLNKSFAEETIGRSLKGLNTLNLWIRAQTLNAAADSKRRLKYGT